MIYVFDHIFKTAGTTFHSSYLPIAFSRSERFVANGFLQDNAKDLQFLVDLPLGARNKFKVVAGHNTGLLRPYFPGARYITLVRNPIERVVSGYLHAKHHSDPQNLFCKYIVEQNVSLSEFVSNDLLTKIILDHSEGNPLSLNAFPHFDRLYAEFLSLHNRQAKTLLGRNYDSVGHLDSEQIIDKIRSRFWSVGCTEQFELFLFFLHKSEGFPLVLFNNRLVQKERKTFHIKEPEIEIIRKFNTIDSRIYKIVREEFDRRVAEIWSKQCEETWQEYMDSLNKYRIATDGSESCAVGFEASPAGTTKPRWKLRQKSGSPIPTERRYGGPSQGFVRTTRSGFAKALSHTCAMLAPFLARNRPLGWFPGWRFGAGESEGGWLGRLRLRLWRLFEKYRLDAPFTIRWYDDLRVVVYLGNDLSRCLYVAGTYEPNEFMFLSQALRPGMIFIDVGANDGLYTLFAAKRVGATGRVLAIEPSTREFVRLQQNLRLNGFSNVYPVSVAAADHDGLATLKIAGFGHEGQNTIGGFAYAIDQEGTEQVRLTSLDSLAQEYSLERVDVIKIDAEGGELGILRGANATIKMFKPLILVELVEGALIHQGATRDSLLAFLRSHSYRFLIFGNSGRPESVSNVDLDGVNVIAVHEERQECYPTLPS